MSSKLDLSPLIIIKNKGSLNTQIFIIGIYENVSLLQSLQAALMGSNIDLVGEIYHTLYQQIGEEYAHTRWL